MKKIAIIFCATLLLSACGAFKSKQPNYLAELTGVYHGDVVSGVSGIPVKTEFFTDKQGLRTGKYEMTEAGGVIVPGTLDNFVQEGLYTLLVSWHDKYGNGYLRMLFTEEKRGFNGFWGHSKDGTLMHWSGWKK